MDVFSTPNKHGLAPTAADKRHAVRTLLQDDVWREWGDREIARHCGVDNKTVARQRRILSEEVPQIHTARKVRRGITIYDMDTSAIGKPAEPEVAETETNTAPPALLPDGSSVLLHTSTPLANGSTPRRRASDLAVPAPPPDPGSSQPADQHVPAWDLDAVVQESVHNLGEIGSQLSMLTEDYRSFTDADGQPFASAWAFATAPLPYGRGCDLEGLLDSITLRATQLETLKTQAAAATVPPVEQVTNMQRVRQVLAELPTTFSAKAVAARTGLAPESTRRALQRLVAAKDIHTVAGKPGWYRQRTKKR